MRPIPAKASMPSISLQLPVGSTIGRSGQEANQRLINGYVETLGDDGEGKSKFVIYADPGLTLFNQDYAYAKTPRGLILLDDNHLLGVLGFQVAKFGTDGTSTFLTNLSGTDHVTMALNMNATPQVAIVTDGGAYYLLIGSSLSVPTTSFGAPNSVCYVKGYYVFTTSAGQIFHSAVDDGTSFNALSFDYANSDPDGLVRGVAHVGYLYAFGKKSLEIWQNVGTTPFAFAPVQQYIEHGLLAKYSVAQNDKGLMWVDHRGIVRWGRDGGAQRVSTHTVERAIEELSDTDRAALRGSYATSQGHEWYTLSSPSWTWVLDLQANRWHQRQSYSNTRWIGGDSIWFNGHWITADYRNGTLYTLNADDFTENGDEFTMELWCKHAHNFPDAFVCDQLNIDVISGAGLEYGDIEDTDPVITVDVSDNGGKTFRFERTASIGKQGDYNKLVSINQWGRISQKGRIWRIRGTSKTLRGVIQAGIDVRPCY